jgi:hypothetical protein
LAIIWLSRGPLRAKIPLHADRVERALRGVAVGPRREPVRAGHTGRGALLLADRVGEAVRGRAAGLSERDGPAGHPVSRGRDARPGPQVRGTGGKTAD